MPIGAHETLRYGIRRGIGISEDTRREAQQTRLVSPDENPERLPIAAQDTGDYFDIRGAVVHHLSDPPGWGFVTVLPGFPGRHPGTSWSGSPRPALRPRTSRASAGHDAGRRLRWRGRESLWPAGAARSPL